MRRQTRVVMAPEVVSDRGFALLQRPAMEKVAESGDQLINSVLCKILLLHDDVLQVLRLEQLLRRDHPSLANWSSTKAPKSSTVRFLEAVKRSNARRDVIARSMKFATAGPAGSSSAEAGWESPPYNNESKLFTIPVSPGEGEFLTRFALGTPAQSFTLILGTGSNLMWTQCLPCEPCLSQIGPEFNPAVSSTYKPVDCGVGLCQTVKELLIYPLVSGSPYGLDLCSDVGSANNNNNPILPDIVFHFTDADFFLTIENLYTSLVDTTSPIYTALPLFLQPSSDSTFWAMFRSKTT
ncbi:unnamed protein product [Sphagnum troendelagicum]|uniref:Peptidase A1 domain-containing protein n=1 Tax=Sphagnum troendelagicum TaxID=128251 RepID=A0ABP0UVP5_9BRYO